MADNTPNTELNGADVFSDWESLIMDTRESTGAMNELTTVGELMTDGGDDHWLKIFQATHLTGMDLVALKLLPRFQHDFKAEHTQLKIQSRIFMLELTNTNRNQLRVAGLSDDQINEMAQGLLPINWTIHLKYPLAYGGTITPHNMIFIPEHPFHEEIHHFINRQTITDAGVIRPATLYVPTPHESVYIPFGTQEKATQVVHFQTTGATE